MTNYSLGALNEGFQNHTYLLASYRIYWASMTCIYKVCFTQLAKKKQKQFALMTPTTKCLHKSMQISFGKNVFI